MQYGFYLLLPCVELKEMKTEIPKELEKFATECAIYKNSDELVCNREYLSDNSNFSLIYVNDIENSSTDGRIKKIDGLVEIDKAKTLIKSSDYVYFLILVLYLTRYLDRNTDDKYAENLLRCDAIAIRNCKEKGLNIKSIVGDSLAMFRITETTVTVKNMRSARISTKLNTSINSRCNGVLA